MTGEQLKTRILVGVALAAAFALTLQAAQAQDYPVHLPDQVIRQSFSLGTAPFVKVDNVNGSIRIAGDGGTTVRLTATEKIKAKTRDLAREALREVTLKLSHTGDSLDASVDGPFRGRHWDNPGYQVRFIFVLHVPARASIAMRSVNGSVKVEDVQGGFEARTVNGSVAVSGAVGAGEARTVNGRITAAFSAEPTGNSSFHTVNGAVDVTLPRTVNARLRYKTFNGKVYSDFDVTPVAGSADVSARTEGGMRVFRRGRWTDGQIGHGGPQLSFDTLNGNIYIRGGSQR